MSLVFYPRNHSYRLDGKPVPGVTTLIGKGLPKPALTYWAARTVAEFVADNDAAVEQMRGMGRGPMVAALKEVPWQKRDTAAIRGTEVHALAEKLAHGEEVQVPEHLAGHVEACVRFLDEWDFQPQLTERPCASRKWRYAGKFDAIGTIRDGRVAAMDWKTSASGIYGETSLQLAAYVNSEFYVDDDGAEHPMPQVDVGLGVWLRADGYDVYEMRVDETAYKAFLHVAWVAKTSEDIKGWKSEALSPPEQTGSAA